MDAWINLALDVVLIGLMIAGIVQATRLIRQLAGLRQGRMEMERFVRDFNTTVVRAESGIKGLRQAARDSGDDLEKLVQKGTALRDELNFLVESADKVASRLSQGASNARPVETRAETPVQAKPQAVETVTPFAARRTPEPGSASQASRAEQELMQALEKLG